MIEIKPLHLFMYLFLTGGIFLIVGIMISGNQPKKAAIFPYPLVVKDFIDIADSSGHVIRIWNGKGEAYINEIIFADGR